MRRHALIMPSGIKSRDDVLAMGIDKYNEECRSIVMR
jgi:isoleucyl-tRNA synthetase